MNSPSLQAAVAFVRVVIRELRWRVPLALALAFALACTEGAGLLLLLPLLQSIGLVVEQPATSRLVAVADRVFGAFGLSPTLISVLFLFLIVSAVQALLYRANLLVNPRLEQQFATALRTRLYTAIVRASWSFFITRRTADLVHGVTTEVDRASSTLYQFLTLFTGLAISAVYGAVAFRVSPLLTTLVVLAGVALLWAVGRGSHRSNEMGQQYAEADRDQFRMASESLAGLKVAKTHGAELRDAEIFGGLARARAATYLEFLSSIAKGKLGLELASAVLLASLLFVAVEWLELRGAALLLLVFVFARVMPRVVSLQQTTQLMLGGLPSFLKVMQLIEESEVRAEQLDGEAANRIPHRQEIRLENLSFSYGAGLPAVLDAVSLSIPAGSTVAIVGASGAGKSTLADILIGLLRPDAGAVLVDGRPLADSDVAAWRRSVGYVPQDGFLLHDTIRANLLWAVPSATEAEMWDALARAAAADFVRARPGGLDTVVGDRGVRLSGGERQRLGLARALLTRPELLVLDEATSALDSANEQQILQAVRELAGRVTTVMITHRLSAIRSADIIHVLESGRLVESGTWDELAPRGGAFAALLLAQGLADPSPLSQSGATRLAPTRAAI